MQPNPDDPLQAGAQPKPPKKAKRVRLLLDARTELTDEELKVGIPNTCYIGLSSSYTTHNPGRQSQLSGGPRGDQARTCTQEVREGKRQDY